MSPEKSKKPTPCRLILVNINTQIYLGPASPASPWMAAVVTREGTRGSSDPYFYAFVFPNPDCPLGGSVMLDANRVDDQWMWPPRV